MAEHKDSAAANKRRHERIKTSLLGRYMLSDKREAKCMVVDISVGGVALAAPEKGRLGEPVVLYIDQLGRVEGKIVRYLDDGFALQLDVSHRAAEKIAQRLKELQAGGGTRPGPERRQEARITLDVESAPRGVAGGVRFQVVDLSFTGADVKIEGRRPPVGSVLKLGRLSAKVVRYTKAGVAVEFISEGGKTLSERLAALA